MNIKNRIQSRFMSYMYVFLATFLLCIAFILSAAITGTVQAYAPSVSGHVYVEGTRAPVAGVWVQWEAAESGCNPEDDSKFGSCRDNHIGVHQRYDKTSSEGRFLYERWDKEFGRETVEWNNNDIDSSLSLQGKIEYQTMIDLDYDPSTGPDGKEERKASTPLFDLFNCHNEMHRFSVRLPEKYKDATVSSRWRHSRTNQWQDGGGNNVILITGQEFNNNVDYILEFIIDSPKETQVRNLEPNEVLDLEDVEQTAGKSPVCINVELCADEDVECGGPQDYPVGNHRVRLLGVGELQRRLAIGNPDEPIWLVECVVTGTAEEPEYICTTGDDRLDRKVFCQNDSSCVPNNRILKDRYGYSASLYLRESNEETTPEITSSNRADVYEWETSTSGDEVITSVFMAMYTPDATSPAESQAINAQQQATLGFADACQLVIDPYGKVFDSVTLEPLGGAEVTLSRLREGGAFTQVRSNEAVGGLVNPQVTQNDGNFSFIVPSGTYRLQSKKPGYIYPANTRAIPQNVQQFYPQPYYGENIVVKDKLERRDIPMEPVDSNQAIIFAESNPVEVTSSFQSLSRVTGTYKIEGEVTHPNAFIEVYGLMKEGYRAPDPEQLMKNNSQESNDASISKQNLTTGTLLASTRAGTDGVFSLTFPMADIPPNEIPGRLIVSKERYDNPNTRSSYTLNPILPVINGFLQYENGSIAKDATVSVVVPGMDVPVYTAQTDSNGYVSIAAANLPNIPYQLEISSQETQRATMNTANFVAFNSSSSDISSSNGYFAQAVTDTKVLGAQSAQTEVEAVLENSELNASEIRDISAGAEASPLLPSVTMIMIITLFAAMALLGAYVYQQGKIKNRKPQPSVLDRKASVSRRKRRNR